MVSPRARPRPSMMPPMTPDLVKGSTTRHITSQVVLPSPYADSFSMRSEEHTSELQSLMRISYAVFCLKKNNNTKPQSINNQLSYSLYTRHTHTTQSR